MTDDPEWNEVLRPVSPPRIPEGLGADVGTSTYDHFAADRHNSW